MKTITKHLYTYPELKELLSRHPDNPRMRKAVENARQWIYEVAGSHDWYDDVLNEWKLALEHVGFTDPDIQFSGFSSQGDGASFTSGIDLPKLLDFINNPPEAGTFDDEDLRPWVVKQLEGTGWVFYPKFHHVRPLTDYLEGSVTRTRVHHYVHEYSTSVELQLHANREFPRIERLVNKFESKAENLRFHLSRRIYRDLEADYDHRTSEEELTELSEANEWHFDLNGTMEG